MNTIAKVLVAVGSVVACLILIAVFGSISAYNEFTAAEKDIVAQYKQNQNDYDTFWKKIKETAQVNEKYSQNLKDIVLGTMSGRYGKDGSKATWQFIQEHNPNIDATLYAKLHNTIVAGREGFENNQKLLLDKKRAYETRLSTFPMNVFASLLKFPRIDLSKIDIVTSDETTTAFETKKAGPIKVF